MEALIILLSSIIMACLIPVGAVLTGIVGLLLDLLFLVVAKLFGAVRRSRAPVDAQPVAPRQPLLATRTRQWIGGALAGVAALGAVASVVLFDPILRYALDRVGAKAGVAIDYDSAEGLLLGGALEMRGIRLVREAEGLEFDIAVDRAAVDLKVMGLIFGGLDFAFAEVEGVSGRVVPPPPRENRPERAKKPARRFEVDRLTLVGVDLEVAPRQGEAYAMVIPRAEVAPLRSRMALFDLLFRSNMEAEIAGQRLSVSTREITADGRETAWRFEDVEAAKLGLLVPRAPLTWFDGGTVSVRVDDAWSLSDHWIDMDWSMTAAGLEASAPEGAGLREKAMAAGLGVVLKAKGGDADFRLKLRLDRDRLEAAGSDDLQALWAVVLDALRMDIEAAAPGKDKPSAMERLKGVLKRDDG